MLRRIGTRIFTAKMQLSICAGELNCGCYAVMGAARAGFSAGAACACSPCIPPQRDLFRPPRSCSAAGYDLPGSHAVPCEGVPKSRTYSIVEPSEDWSEWPAYHFAGADICGRLVRIKNSTAKPLTVPMTNPLLIGAEPGQVFRCSSRNVTR